MKTILRYLLILPLIAVTSCLREQFEDIPYPHEGERDVNFKLSLPYLTPQMPVTRAIGATQENYIETIDILAFEVDDGNNETFQYWVSGVKSAGTGTQSFTAKLRVKDKQQRFVIISNAQSKIEKLIGSRPSGGWVGVEKEALLSQLILDLNGSDKWKAISPSNYTAIPMWGETKPETITEKTNEISDKAIKMLRMIAKIEVQLDKSVSGLTNKFKLQSVHLYNTNTSGRIVPKPGTEYVNNNRAQKPVKESRVIHSTWAGGRTAKYEAKGRLS